jgi:hypothetical protein
VGVDFLKEIFYLNHSLGAVTSEREEALGLFAIITIAQALSIVMVSIPDLSRSIAYLPCLYRLLSMKIAWSEWCVTPGGAELNKAVTIARMPN